MGTTCALLFLYSIEAIFTSVDRKGRSTSYFHLWQTLRFSISTSQIFRSWVAIFQRHPPMASLFRSLYDMPGIAPRMDVLSWGRRDFQIFSNRDTSRNAWNHHWGSLWSIRGSYQTIWSSPLTMLNDICDLTHIQWQPPTDQTLYRTRPFTEFWEVSIEPLRWVWHADRGYLLSGNLVLSHLGLHLFIKPKTHYLLVTLPNMTYLPKFTYRIGEVSTDICNGCGMPAGDADSPWHLVPSLWTYMCSTCWVQSDYALRISLDTFSILPNTAFAIDRIETISILVQLTQYIHQWHMSINNQDFGNYLGI